MAVRIQRASLKGWSTMYCDVAQWSSIRRQVLQDGVSIRRVARETGISPKTVRKMLDQPLPKPYGPRGRRHPKLGPHIASVQRMVEENAMLPPSARKRLTLRGFSLGRYAVRPPLTPGL